ncbi:MAG: hypothetical protein RL272_1313, partial [Candidatus Parcubacteria bacterium]
AADNTYDLGSTSLRWKTLHVGPGSVVVHNDATNTQKLTLDFSGANASRIASDATSTLRLTTGANIGLDIDTSGNVGIGDTSPAALLTVGSGDLFQVNSSGNLTSPADATWTLGGGVDGLNFDANTLSIDASNNRVGIGTASPSTPLEVVGNDATGAISLSSTDTIGTSVYWKAPSGGIGWQIYNTGSGASQGAGKLLFHRVTDGTGGVAVFDSSGRFGIGDLTPAALLTVGTSDAFQVDSSGNVTTAADVAVNGADLTTTASTGNLFNTNATTVNVGGAATSLNLAGGSGSTGCTINGSGDLACTGALSSTGNFLPAADNTYDLGSTSLRWKTLHVGPGSVVVHNDATNTQKLTIDFSGANASRIASDATSTLKLTTGANTGLNIDTSGNVGIGITSPGARLEVLDVTNGADVVRVRGSNTGTGIGQYHQLTVINQDTSASTTVGLGFQHYNASSATVDAAVIDATLSAVTAGSESGNLRFSTRNSGTVAERMRIDNAGNVGINTSTSTRSLQVENTAVNGNVPILSRYLTSGTASDYPGLAVLAESSGDMANNFGSMVEYQIKDAASSVQAIGRAGFVRDGNDGLGRFSAIPYDSGSPRVDAFNVQWGDATGPEVGIGITDPTTALHIVVNDSIGTVPPILRLQNLANHPAADVGIRFNSFNQDFSMGIDETDDSFRITDGVDLTSAARLIIDASGDVAINDTTPDAMFDIDQPAASAGSPKLVSWTGGAHTGLAASTEAIDVDFALNRTVQFATGALTMQRAVVVRPPTYAFAGASTLSVAATMNVEGLPAAGTNASITSSVGLMVGDVSGDLSAATARGVGTATFVPGITSGTGATTLRSGLWITTPNGDVSLGNQTATLDYFNAARIDDITLNSTTNTRTVTEASSLYVRGAPTAGTNVTITNGPYAIHVDDGDTRLDGGLLMPTPGARIDFASGTAGNTFKWMIPTRASGTCSSGTSEGVLFLDSSSIQRGHMCIDSGTPLLKFYANQFNTTATDIAETYSTRPEDGIEAGDVVELDPAGDLMIRKTTGKAAAGTFGIVSTAPGVVLSGIDEATGKGDTSNGVNVALSGRVPVKVSMENGPIAVGDELTSSSAPGVAMRATENGMVIGRALDAASSNGTVRVFVEVGWWNGAAVLGVTTTSGAGNLSTLTVGTTDFDGHDLLNARSIHGIGDAWSLDEDGRLTAMEVVTDSVRVRQSDTKTTLDRAVIASGQDFAQVHNSAITPDSRVFVTMKKNPGSQWWVDEVGDGFIVVKTAQPVTEDIPFDYWLVDVLDERTPPAATQAPAPPADAAPQSPAPATEDPAPQPPPSADPAPQPQPEPAP